MFLGKSLTIAILLLPFLEIAVFVLVATQIGVLQAFGLIFLACVAGVLLLRHAGRSQMNRLRAALAEGNRPEIKDLGLSTFLAGVLLLIPGFLTDILAIMLLIPPVRRLLAGAFGHMVVTKPPSGEPSVVDLDQDEWRRVPEAELPPPQRPDPSSPWAAGDKPDQGGPPEGGSTHKG